MAKSDSLAEDQLPEPGQCIEIAPESRGDLASKRSTPSRVLAAQAWRHSLDVKLELPQRYGQRAAVRPLAEFLLPLQETVDAIIYGSAVDIAPRGQLPAGMLPHTEITFQAQYHGSFGMVLSATEQADLFGNAQIASGLERLVELIDCGSNRERLHTLLGSIHQRAASRYARLLGSLLRLDAGLHLAWVPPTDVPGRSASMSMGVAREALKIVNEAVLQMPEEITVHGTLVGINVRLRSYEIAEVASGKRFSGKIAEGAPGIEHARIQDSYLARIERIVEVAPVTGTEQTRWQLVGLVPVGREDEPSTSASPDERGS